MQLIMFLMAAFHLDVPVLKPCYCAYWLTDTLLVTPVLFSFSFSSFFCCYDKSKYLLWKGGFDINFDMRYKGLFADMSHSILCLEDLSPCLSLWLTPSLSSTDTQMHAHVSLITTGCGSSQTSLHAAFWVSSLPSVSFSWVLSHTQTSPLDARQHLNRRFKVYFVGFLYC